MDLYEQGGLHIDRSIVTSAPYPLFIGDNTPWFVVKNSTLDRRSSGQHTIRTDGPGQEKILVRTVDSWETDNRPH